MSWLAWMSCRIIILYLSAFTWKWKEIVLHSTTVQYNTIAYGGFVLCFFAVSLVSGLLSATSNAFRIAVFLGSHSRSIHLYSWWGWSLWVDLLVCSWGESNSRHSYIWGLFRGACGFQISVQWIISSINNPYVHYSGCTPFVFLLLAVQCWQQPGACFFHSTWTDWSCSRCIVELLVRRKP